MFDRQAETLPFAEQAKADDQTYRRQIAYLCEHSAFYQAKLSAAGFSSAEDVGGLERLSCLPFTEKDELRQSRSEYHPIGTHLAVPMGELSRIYSTSGTTGTPSFIPLTRADLETWVRISCRSYAASGIRRGQRIVTTYNAGPFVAAVTLDAFNALDLIHIPVGSGNTDRLLSAVRLLKPEALALTPSYALHISERARDMGIDLASSGVRHLLVAGEPGGGEAPLRHRLEAAWGAKVTEAMGIGDIAVSLWGECHEQSGMHFSGRGYVHFELIDPVTGLAVPIEDGAEGELVYTHLNHRASPLLRFRSRDHVRFAAGRCACGRTSPRMRCIGRTDDMLIVRGVNVFPSAIREIVGEFSPAVSGHIAIRPQREGVRQEPPLPITVELPKDSEVRDTLAEEIARRIRDRLLVSVRIETAPWGSLPRTDYKSRLVDWTGAKS